MAVTEIPQWALSQDEQKQELERHLRGFLSPDANDLAPHERFFLAETIGLTNRGLFGLARVALCNAYDEAGQFVHYAMDPEVIAKATPSNLRCAFQYLESTPAREHPVFR